MSQNVIQTSFQAGELSPSIAARTDLSKYHTGAATMRNFFVDYRSGASSRPGTKFVIQGLLSSTAIRLIPYQFSSTVSYMIEFGDKYCRFISNGAAVLESAFAVTGATNTDPGQITAPGNNFVNGDWVFVQGVGGASGYNGRYYTVTLSGTLVNLFDTLTGHPIDASAFGTYTSGGSIARVYKIASPYAAADLALLKFAQINNVMTLTHTSYPPYQLVATSATSWAFTQIVFGTTVSAPTGLTTSTSPAGSWNYAFIVTAVDSSGQESLSSSVAALASAVDYSSTAGTITVTWNAVIGADHYNVYLAEPSIAGAVPSGAAFGFVGQTTALSFPISNIKPDFTQTPPIVQTPFAGGNNPGCLTYFQQRLYFAASATLPTTFWASQPGLYSNFNKSDPIQDDDAYNDTIVSKQLNAIKSMLSMPGGLIMLTSFGAWQLSSGGGLASTSAVTPTNATATPQAYNGASDLPPIPINFDIIYVQAKGAIVRDLSYNIYANIYTGTDISVLSNHLFFGRQLVYWDYAEEPFKLVWAVRDDGILLSLTFVKEQEIYGWARHDTLGLFQCVACVTENQVDATYVVVKRQIQGQWIQMIERFAERTFPYGAEDAWSVDCGLRSTLPVVAAGLTASSSTGTVTFTADSAVFSAGDVTKVLRMDGGIATITAFVSPTQLTGTWTQDPTTLVPNDPALTPVPATSGNWTLTSPSTVFSGLDHLEGQTVSILADGSVIAPQVVTNGKITLAKAATKVVAGLGFTAQLQTMRLDVGEPTIQGKRKKISALTVRMADTRGLSCGSTFGTLVPIKELTPSITLNMATPLVTGDERIIMDPSWNVEGQICIETANPLPASVLGVIPEITVGDTPSR